VGAFAVTDRRWLGIAGCNLDGSAFGQGCVINSMGSFTIALPSLCRRFAVALPPLYHRFTAPFAAEFSSRPSG
jgi:hypothetical protein